MNVRETLRRAYVVNESKRGTNRNVELLDALRAGPPQGKSRALTRSRMPNARLRSGRRVWQSSVSLPIRLKEMAAIA